MAAGHEFLKNLALVLCVAAVTTVVFQRLRQPVILGYLLAGLIIGPHVPVPLVADAETIQTLSELGVILLMFSLGLEFRLRKLVKVGATVAVVALIEVSLMMWLGFAASRMFGWSERTSLFAGAAVAISSTSIIAKVFEERDIKGGLRDLVFGVLIFEDLVAILLLTTLTTLSSGAQLSTGSVAITTVRLIAFLLGILVAGMLVIPRLVRVIVRLGRPETILVSTVGICFAVALLAHAAGYSVALGAFLAGALVAESGEEKRIVPVVKPVRDMFAAIFFVAAGMSINPATVLQHWPAVLVLLVVVLAGKIVSVTLGAFLAGHPTRTAVQAGMSLAQIGEFSFIIASLGVSRGGASSFLYPVALAVSALTALSTPWLIQGSGRVSNVIDRALPKPLQTFVALYGSWVEALRKSPLRETTGTRVRRLVRMLLLDALVLGALIVGSSLALRGAAAFLSQRLSFDPALARHIVIAAGLALAAPFFFGIVGIARRLGMTLAETALPTGSGGADLAAAPRRALVVTLQLAIVLIVGAPLVALTQPFLPPFRGALVLLALLAFLAFAFWRSATNLQGHVRAGAEMIVEVLATQSRSRRTGEHTLEPVQRLLPGLGTPVPFRLDPVSPAVGKTLAQLNLRGATGATVLAITRGEQGLVVPAADETLQVGDVLALAGTNDAIRAATALLAGPRQSSSRSVG